MIRPAHAEDAPAMLRIYEPAVVGSPISFETELPSEADFALRIATSHAWLVYEEASAILGYAYASKHRERAAYGWCVESSVYVAAGHHRKGIGRKLYEELFRILREKGFYNVYAGITLPSTKSVAFHESCGFTLVGTYSRIGYKLGQWHDVAWWQLRIQEGDPKAQRSSVEPW